MNAISFQARVAAWMRACFDASIAADPIERNHRFLEEALELVQARGCTASEAHQLVDYVFGRPVGDPFQEVGGVEVTLAALCSAAGRQGGGGRGRARPHLDEGRSDPRQTGREAEAWPLARPDAGRRAAAMKSTPARHPTPADREWWRVTLMNLIRAFREPRPVTPEEIFAQVDQRAADLRAALRGEGRR